MKVNLRTLMRKNKMKNLSELSYKSKVPFRNLEDIVLKGVDNNNAFGKLLKFFQCTPKNLIEKEGTLWKFYGNSYDPVSGLVYFVKNKENGFVKIGFTVDLLTRFQNLTYEHQVEMEVLHFVPTYDAAGLEKVFHSLYSEKRVDGEWFDLSDDDLKTIKKA
jgi:hypothetical protein